uniref:Uncharacterized protein n=1 Tax=Plectus sambesii TaxID=2011161 RepID=A0A914XJS4_9BILA
MKKLFVAIWLVLVLASSAMAAPTDLSNFSLGLGKRMDPNSYGIGFGKRMDSTAYQIGLGKRQLSKWDTMKRVDPQSFPIGFGKRSFDYLQGDFEQ